MTMLLLRKYWLPLLLVVAAAYAITVAYDKGNANGKATVQAQWDKAKLEQQQVVVQAKERDIKAANAASVDYQKERASNAEQTRIVRQTVVRTVTGPCFDDDGVRHLNAAISGLPAASAAR